jgi:hypothetical protein
MDWRCRLVIENLPSMWKALGSIPSTALKKKVYEEVMLGQLF